LQTANISNIHADGDPSTSAASPAPGKEEGTTGKGETKAPAEDFMPLESNAEYPGGRQAWTAFLNRHLRTPAELEAGQKRVVMVKFAVGVDGSITHFEIIQSGGTAFDNEVIRVLKKMPKWKPAVQNGRNVAVMFTQPVTFMAFEE
jgi:protein TonB